MKRSLLPVLAAVAAAWDIPPWAPPGPDDVRGPCPGLNTLANHGFLPHSGKNITQAQLSSAMLNGVNQDESISVLLFNVLVRVGLASNDNTTFSLLDLGRHDVLEHDASFSRQDAQFGDPNPFNEAAWNETLQYWTEDTININTSATAHIARIRTSNATNPNFGLSGLAKGFLSGESIAFIMVFGDVETGVVPKDSVTYWFENERFPPGYAPPANVVTSGTLSNLSRKFDAALAAQGLNYSGIPAPPSTTSVSLQL